MSSGKLVMMANQIGRFFVPQRGVDPVAAIVAHLDKGGEGLDETVRQAVLRLKDGRS